MSGSFHQPRSYDVVKGGQNPPPISGAVLGGLEGVKQRLASAALETRIAMLSEALKYGQDGLDLVIQSLNDPANEVQWAAYSLLKARTELSVRSALQDYIPVIYRKLHNLLTDQNWKAADLETAAVMLQIANREQEGWLRVEDINSFPSLELCTIDQMWTQYSNGHFGFSVQKQIWQSVSCNYRVFGDRVEWRRRGAWLNYAHLTFSTTAPAGHLPAKHLTWGSLKTGQMWMWYAGTEEDARWVEVKTLLSRRDL